MELQALSRMVVRKLGGAPAQDATRAADKLSAGISTSGASMGIDRLTLAQKPAAPTFHYEGMSFPDVSAARSWTPKTGGMSGTDANQIVTETYHQLDQVFSAYLGAPDVSNWLTFGKYASHEAGAQITDLEQLLTVKQLKPRTLKALAGDIGDPTLMKQGLSAFKVEGKHYEQGLKQAGKVDSLRAQIGFAPFLKDQAEKLHASLVVGNTKVYHDVTPAYDLFLKAESAGQDGVAALKLAGFGHSEADPQGLILKAFSGYQAANRVWRQASRPDVSSAEREALLAKRKELVGRANLDMVTNEQMVILQGADAFGDPDIARLTGAVSGTMRIHDALGAHELLPNGGNWTDFATRMGFQEVPLASVPGALSVRDHQNVAHDYVLASDRPGTISRYFEDNLSETRSRKMIATNPDQIAMR